MAGTVVTHMLLRHTLHFEQALLHDRPATEEEPGGQSNNNGGHPDGTADTGAARAGRPRPAYCFSRYCILPT